MECSLSNTGNKWTFRTVRADSHSWGISKYHNVLFETPPHFLIRCWVENSLEHKFWRMLYHKRHGTGLDVSNIVETGQLFITAVSLFWNVIPKQNCICQLCRDCSFNIWNNFRGKSISWDTVADKTLSNRFFPKCYFPPSSGKSWVWRPLVQDSGGHYT